MERGYREPDKVLFSDYAEHWFRVYKLNKIEPTSFSRLYNIYHYQVKGYFGHRKLAAITTKDIQTLLNNYARPPEDEDIVPLLHSTLKKIMEFLKPLFECAIMEERIFVNPCRFVVIPKEDLAEKPTRYPRALTDEEIQIFGEAVTKKKGKNGEYRSRDGLTFMILLNLGLRASEMLALEWSDFDFEKRFVKVNKTLQHYSVNYAELMPEGKTQMVRVKNSAKTRSGNRILYLNDTLIYYLMELKEYDKRNGIVSSHLVCTRNGTRVNYQNYRRSLIRLTRGTCISDVTLHSLRHTCGTILLRKGVPIEVISKILGHSKISITYNIYIHILQEQQVEALKTVSVSEISVPENMGQIGVKLIQMLKNPVKSRVLRPDYSFDSEITTLF